MWANMPIPISARILRWVIGFDSEIKARVKPSCDSTA